MITSLNIPKDSPEEATDQRTFILMWNPKISSYSLDEFSVDVYTLSDNDEIELNWSIADWREAREGDSFYMVKVGKGKCGIVMSGTFKSRPYLGKDWEEGKRRKILYVDLKVKHMINPNLCPLLTTKMLSKAIPDFEWDGGTSGRLLTAEQAETLNALWEKYIYKHYYIFLPRAAEARDERIHILVD